MGRRRLGTEAITWTIEPETGESIDYEVEYDYTPGSPGTGLFGRPEDAEPPYDANIEIVSISGPNQKGKISPEIPEADWEKIGFTDDVIDSVKQQIIDERPTQADLDADRGDYEYDQRKDDRLTGDRDEAHKGLTEAPESMPYRINNPGHPAHDLEYVIWYDMEPAATGDQPIDSSGSKPVIQYITRAGSPEKRLPDDHWERFGFTADELDAVVDTISNAEHQDFVRHGGRDEAQKNLAEGPWVNYTIKRPGQEDQYYEVSFTYETGEGGPEIEITRIARADDPEIEIPSSEWEALGFTTQEMRKLQDVLAHAAAEDWRAGYDDSRSDHKRDFDEAVGRWARLKGGMGNWPAGSEVTITREIRNSDGSREVLIKGPDGKSDQLHLDQGEDLSRFVEMLEMRKIGMSMNEMRGLAGLPVKPEGSNIKVTDADRAVLKDWRRMATNPSKNLTETSETGGGAIVPAGFVFPDMGSLLGYTQKKLPVSLLRSVDRMTTEGQNTMALMLNELQKLKPATDQLVEIFAGICEGIDKFDAGSIEGREVARVFRFLADASRFVQGGAELTEQL